MSAVRSETDLRSLSNGVRSLGVSNGSDGSEDSAKEREAFLEDVEQLDDATKIVLLKEMFPRMNEYTISHSLKKCNGVWNRAMEELLNHAFFAGDELVDGHHKVAMNGIDAFSEDNTARRGRKKKDKRKAKALDEDKRSSSLPATADSNTSSPWETARKDVEFINSRTRVSASTISSMYHKNGASVSATIIALLETSPIIAATKTTPSDPVIVANAAELGRDFPSLSSHHLVSLVRLTHPSNVAAHELAQTLISRKRNGNGGIQVIPQYSPIKVDSDEEVWKAPARPSSSSGTHTPINMHDPTVLAISYSIAQHRAFDQASAAYRRGKSDHLMSAAAGYYSQVGRDYAARRVEATAEAADELVASQSTREQVDLHGVTVKDAVRIARQQVEGWWRQGGGRGAMGFDGRVVTESGGTAQGIRIVTGIGRHSQGGKAKIGPAVGRMLATEGWKVVIGEGVFTVIGKNR